MKIKVEKQQKEIGNLKQINNPSPKKKLESKVDKVEIKTKNYQMK